MFGDQPCNCYDDVDDVFAATPDTSFMKFLVSKAATDKRFAMLISDISVASCTPGPMRSS